VGAAAILTLPDMAHTELLLPFPRLGWIQVESHSLVPIQTQHGVAAPALRLRHPARLGRHPRLRCINAAVQPLVRYPQLRLCVIPSLPLHSIRSDLLLLLLQPWGSATASTAAWDGAAARERSPATTSTPAAATTTAASTRKVCPSLLPFTGVIDDYNTPNNGIIQTTISLLHRTIITVLQILVCHRPITNQF
jgi:hypothetical protein